MVEWMAHHQRLGVGRFYIFDNGSNPPLNGSFAEQILSGLVKCACKGSQCPSLVLSAHLHGTCWAAQIYEVVTV